VLQDVQCLIEHAELVDKVGTDSQVFRQLHLSIHLSLKISNTVIREDCYRPRTSIEQLGQFDADVDQRALSVLAIVIFESVIQVTRPTDRSA
jgi:hypothetical protein